MRETFLWLLFAHYLFDFSLQTQFMSEWKQKSHYIMFVHVIVWTGGICLAMKLLSIPIQREIVIMLFVVHYLVDWAKCEAIKSGKLTPKGIRNLFLSDQIIHIMQLIAVLGSIPQ